MCKIIFKNNEIFLFLYTNGNIIEINKIIQIMRNILIMIVVFGLNINNVLFAQTKQASDLQALVTVEVFDFQNHIRKYDQIIFEGINSKKVFEGVSDSSGKFDILIDKGDTYKIKIKGIGEAQDYNTLAIPAGKGIAKGKITIKYEPAKTFELKNLDFDFGKATIKVGSDKILKDVITVLNLKKSMKIEIAGYTDNVGSDVENLKLSQNRAEAVRNYLITKGKIDASRIVAKGYGETNPIADNDSEEGRKQNRRTEVYILSE